MPFLPMLKLPLATGHHGWLAPELVKVLRWGRATLGGCAGGQWYPIAGGKRNPSLVPHFKFGAIKRSLDQRPANIFRAPTSLCPAQMETLPRV